MDRIEINAVTGQSQVITLSAAEEAEAIALHNAIEAIAAPKRAQVIADSNEREAAKLSPVIQYLVSHTNAEIRQYVANVSDLAELKTIVGHLAVAVAVMARKELR